MPLSTTAEKWLAEIGRRIDVLDASAQAGTQQTSRAIRRRVTGLREGEGSARAAVYDAAASIEENMLQLETRVNIAEQAAAADLAEDMDRFLGAIMEELHSWDVYLERLQVKVATSGGNDREQAERAIGMLRRHRNTLGGRLREVPVTSGDAWREVREHVQATRDELEAQAAEVEATLAEGGGIERRRGRPSHGWKRSATS